MDKEELLPEVEYELVYKIQHEKYSLLFYPVPNIMDIEYEEYIEAEDDYESITITIYDTNGWDLSLSPVKDQELLIKYHNIMIKFHIENNK